ncbi:MAG: response regulator [Candidatus Aminicenantales bacterium]
MSKKIVIIDDDKVTLTILTMTLLRQKYQIFSALDGAEGWDLIMKEKPDIVISDMLLPKIDGISLCQKIKANSDLKGIKVILMSAIKNLALQMEAKGSGADEFIEKPIDMNGLLNLLNKFKTD